VPKVAKRQFLIKVAGVDGFFATRTGGRKTAATTKVFDGGSTTPDVLTAPALYSDIVVGRPYDPDRDDAIVAFLDPLVGNWDTAVDVTPTDGNLVPTGRTRHYRGRLADVNYPEQDAKSGDEAALELTITIVAAS
jgi:hypothetical protein